MDGLSTTQLPESSLRSASVAVHAGMFLSGMLTALLGPLLPVLSARWSLTDAQAGYFFTALFAGSMTGAVLTGATLPRRGFRFALVLGFALTAAGDLVLGLGNWAAGLLAVFTYGVGLGFTIACSNLWVSDSFPRRRAAALSVLNFAFGLGAVASPAIFAMLLRTGRSGSLLYALAAAFGLVAFCLARIPFPEPRRESEEASPEMSRASVWSSRFGPVLGAMFFLYVGTENALGGWVASYAKRISVGSGTLWVLAPSFFWGALLLGRALAPAVLRYVTEVRIVLCGLVLAALGSVALLAAKTLAAVLGGAILAGFGLSAIYPIQVAWISPTLGAAAPRLAGRMFAMGALGGATLPWLVGYLSTQYGSLKSGLVAPLLGSVVMLVMLLASPPPAARHKSHNGETGS